MARGKKLLDVLTEIGLAPQVSEVRWMRKFQHDAFGNAQGWLIQEVRALIHLEANPASHVQAGGSNHGDRLAESECRVW